MNTTFRESPSRRTLNEPPSRPFTKPPVPLVANGLTVNSPESNPVIPPAAVRIVHS